ncbi:MAG: flagellar biosynthesis protein FlhB [Ilumatobacter sp.]
MPSKQDKTELPTPKKKKEIREKGEFARSQDLTAWMSVLIGLYVVPIAAGRLASVLDASLNLVNTTSMKSVTAADGAVLLGTTLRAGFLAVAPMLAVAWAASFLASFAQVGPMISLKAVKPDFKRVNPKSGFKRLFSPKSLWETAKQLIKVVAICVAAWAPGWALVNDLIGPSRPEFGGGLAEAGRATLSMVRNAAWAMFLLSLADYGYQRYQFQQDQKMTKQEVKDESKNAEGDAQVKGRMRAAQRDLARNRMLADVGGADVIITNPTHIAVAIRYDMASGGAPTVVETGAGNVAAKIREVGREAGVQLVEAKPLARALWRACDVGDEVPVALYEAVAKVLVFVRRLDRRMRRDTPIDLPRASRVEAELLESIPAKRNRRRG